MIVLRGGRQSVAELPGALGCKCGPVLGATLVQDDPPTESPPTRLSHKHPEFSSVLPPSAHGLGPVSQKPRTEGTGAMLRMQHLAWKSFLKI